MPRQREERARPRRGILIGLHAIKSIVRVSMDFVGFHRNSYAMGQGPDVRPHRKEESARPMWDRHFVLGTLSNCPPHYSSTAHIAPDFPTSEDHQT